MIVVAEREDLRPVLTDLARNHCLLSGPGTVQHERHAVLRAHTLLEGTAQDMGSVGPEELDLGQVPQWSAALLQAQVTLLGLAN